MSPSAELARANILLVDDRPGNLLSLREVLENPGYNLVLASSGEDALRRILRSDFAVILLDVAMPGMDGFEMAEIVKQDHRFRYIPIIFVTASDIEKEKVFRAYQVGAVDYVQKPIDPHAVRAKVATFVELSRQRQAITRQAALLREADRKEREQALSEFRLASERRYRNLAESVPQIVWNARPDGAIAYFNQRWFDATGLSEAQSVEWGWLSAVHPDDATGVREHWPDARRSVEPFQLELRLRHAADGVYRWHLCRALLEPGEAGRTGSWLGTFTDIDAQRRADEERRHLLFEEQRARARAEAGQRRQGLQFSVVSLLAGAESLEEAAPRALAAIGEALGWDASVLWTVDPQAGALRAVEVWTAAGLSDAGQRLREVSFGSGEGLAGEVWETGQTTWGEGLDAGAFPGLEGALPWSTALVIPIRSGKKVLFLLGLLARQGRPRDEEVLTTAVTLGGQIGLFVERARARADLLESEERLAITLRSIGDAVVATDDLGNIDFMNHVAEGLTGWTQAEAQGRPLDETFHLIDQKTGAAAESPIAEVIRDKENVTLANHTALVRRDGSEISIEDSAAPILNEKAHLLGTVLVFRDVTERRLAGERKQFLAEATRLFLSTLDFEETIASAAQLVIPELADGCVVCLYGEGTREPQLAAAHIDPAKTGILGALARALCDPAAPQTPELAALQAGEPVILPELDEALLLASLARNPAQLEAARKLHLRSVMGVPLLARGQSLGFMAYFSEKPGRRFGPADLGVARELAERAAIAVDNARLYADSKAAIQLRDEFLSVASHELRTPLTALLLQVQSLQHLIRKSGVSPGPQVPGKLEAAAKQVRRLAALIDNLLDVSRISAGKLQLQTEPFDLAEITAEVVERFQEEAKRAGSPLELAAGAEARGQWDRLRVEQVLTNLVSNAIKYGGAKPIELALHATPEEVRITVRDHGIGISAENATRIFGRFERAVPTRQYGGLGLGLYIVRQIVEAHGGRIWVESQEGQGSAFVVELPRHPLEQEAGAPLH